MAQVPDTLVVNSTNLGAYGLEWSRRSGWRSFPQATVITHQYPAGIGELFQAREENKARVLTVTGTIKGDDVGGLYTNLNAIASIVRGSGLQIGFSDDERVVFGDLALAEIGEYDPGALTPIAPFTFRFICPDPLRYDTATQNINASTDLPLGTAPVKPIITITGSAANPTTLEYRDRLGATIASFTMAAALASGSESWIINCKTKSVQFDDGSAVDALADFSGEFFTLDPADADFLTSDWPQIVVTAGAPSDVDIEYERAWM